MSRKYRPITAGKLPSRICPHRAAQVLKAVIHGQLSYECSNGACRRFGPWDDAPAAPRLPT